MSFKMTQTVIGTKTLLKAIIQLVNIAQGIFNVISKTFPSKICTRNCAQPLMIT